MARGYITPAVVGRRIYAIGGDINIAGSLFAQTTVESMLTPNGVWKDVGVADLPVPCDEAQAFPFRSGPLQNLIVLAGCGQWPNAIPDTYVYSTGSNSWTYDGAFNETRRNHAGVMLKAGQMFVLGGYASDGATALTSTEAGAGSTSADRPGFVGPDRISGGKPTTS
jgi:hypothetical protein